MKVSPDRETITLSGSTLPAAWKLKLLHQGLEPPAVSVPSGPSARTQRCQFTAVVAVNVWPLGPRRVRTAVLRPLVHRPWPSETPLAASADLTEPFRWQRRR